MTIEEEILINKYGQNLIPAQPLTEKFKVLDLSQKASFLNDMLHLIMQSKPEDTDIEPAIIASRLKPTFTPCVLLQKGVANHHLRKIIELPEPELNKAFALLLNLFKVAYKRRFDVEKNSLHKWWYWDLSDDAKIKEIMQKF